MGTGEYYELYKKEFEGIDVVAILDNDGIVVALNEGNANEARKLLECRLEREQILYPVGYN